MHLKVSKVFQLKIIMEAHNQNESKNLSKLLSHISNYYKS